MDFLSISFAVFLIILIVVLYFIKQENHREVLLLIASYIFYAFSDIRFMFLLIFVSVMNYFIGKKIARREKSEGYFILGIIFDILVLFVFKYFDFFISGFSGILGLKYDTAKIIIPLGISFYVLEALSYLFDVKSHKIQCDNSIVKVLLYIGFFPQIVSGPIIKARDFINDSTEHRIELNNISEGIQRIVIGIFKKRVIADRLSVCVDSVYSAVNCYSSMSVICAVVSYSLQIYYDFSGYSDIAIGIAKLLGYDYKENFNLPYLAKNPSEFFRRWHISLSSWFMEYVYIPLGGSKKGKIRTYINVFITMFLSGLWHGLSLAYIIWGFGHAFASMVHKLFKDSLIKKNILKEYRLLHKFVNILSAFLMYILAAILWIPFRTNSLSLSKDILQRIFACSSGVNYMYDYTIIFVIFTIFVEVFACKRCNGDNPLSTLDLAKFKNKIIFIAFVFITIAMSYRGNTAFIYSNF